MKNWFLYGPASAVVLACSMISPVLGINPVGISSNNQDYIDLSNNTDDFLAVNQIVVGGSALCSATWLGGEYLLTARHCGGNTNPGSVVATFANGLSVSSVDYWASNLSGNNNDLAIVRLSDTPALPSNYVPGKVRANNNGVPGQLGTLVGYGGIGRSAGHNTITVAGNTGEINAHRPTATGLQLGANLIPGDSGGPIMVQEPDNSFSVVGVAAVIFGNTDVWSNPVAYSEQIEFGLQYNHWSFFQNGTTPPMPGDLTLDNEVDMDDVDAFVLHWQTEHSTIDLTAWSKGDLNGDGITGLADWGLLRMEYPLLAAAIADQLFLAVPEPASSSLVLLGVAACFSRSASRNKVRMIT